MCQRWCGRYKEECSDRLFGREVGRDWEELMESFFRISGKRKNSLVTIIDTPLFKHPFSLSTFTPSLFISVLHLFKMLKKDYKMVLLNYLTRI